MHCMYMYYKLNIDLYSQVKFLAIEPNKLNLRLI